MQSLIFVYFIYLDYSFYCFFPVSSYFGKNWGFVNFCGKLLNPLLYLSFSEPPKIDFEILRKSEVLNNFGRLIYTPEMTYILHNIYTVYMWNMLKKQLAVEVTLTVFWAEITVLENTTSVIFPATYYHLTIIYL